MILESPILTVIEAAAEHFAVPVCAILGGDRHKNAALARRVAMHVLRGEPWHRSYTEIARIFGQHDHSSAMWACRRAEADVARGEPRFVAAVAAVRGVRDAAE